MIFQAVLSYKMTFILGPDRNIFKTKQTKKKIKHLYDDAFMVFCRKRFVSMIAKDFNVGHFSILINTMASALPSHQLYKNKQIIYCISD